MTTAVGTFSLDLLNHFDKLKTLFSGENELREIDRLSKNAFVRPNGQLYYSRWRIAWINAIGPLKLIFHLFIKALATLLNCLFLSSIANRLHLAATHFVNDSAIADHQHSLGTRFLIPSINEYRQDISDVYSQCDVHRENIPDPKIRRFLNEKIKRLQFNRIGKGLCNGGVHWFNYLFLKSMQTELKNRVNTLAEYASAIAKQFEGGQPRQAALMQTLYGVGPHLLNLKERAVATILPATFKSTGLMYKHIKHLPDGIYHLKLQKHSISYIQFKKEQLIWDPSKGLITLKKPRDLVKIIQESRLRDNEPIYFIVHGLEIS